MTEYDLFFLDPSVDPSTNPSGQNIFSNLYLLRRDIYHCYGFDIKTKTKLKCQVQTIWPGVMAIMAGIDLMAKFHSGNDKINESGPRFQCFIKQYISLNESEILYQLRNSLLHSFGLYSYRQKLNKQTDQEEIIGEWHFKLATNPNSQLVVVESKDHYRIDVLALHSLFEESIALFKKEYPTLNSYTKFRHYSDLYGWTKLD